MRQESIVCPVQKWSTEAPDRNAIKSGDESISYRELHDRVCQVEKYLASAGLRQGDRVGIIAIPTPTAIAFVWACVRRGVVVAPISDRFPPELRDSIAESLNLKIIFDEFTKLDHLTRRADQIADHSDEKDIILPLHREASIILTSGSSGNPKGVLHTLGNHWHSAAGSEQHLPLSEATRWLLTIPFYHIGGFAIVVRCLLAGACVVLDKDDTLQTTVARQGVTHVSLVATQLYRLLEEQPGKRLNSLQVVLVGGGPVSQSLRKTAREAGLPLFITYGSTEACSQVTLADASNAPAGSSGHVLRYRQIIISDTGEIEVGGETLGVGYIVNGATEKFRNADGLFSTGDLGELDESGELTVLGRTDNMFISGGENIYPEQIERALQKSAMVSRALIVPIPSEEFGNRPFAFVEMAPGCLLDENAESELSTVLAQQLPRFMIPEAFEPWDGATEDTLKTDRRYWRGVALSLSGKPGDN